MYIYHEVTEEDTVCLVSTKHFYVLHRYTAAVLVHELTKRRNPETNALQCTSTSRLIRRDYEHVDGKLKVLVYDEAYDSSKIEIKTY